MSSSLSIQIASTRPASGGDEGDPSVGPRAGERHPARSAVHTRVGLDSARERRSALAWLSRGLRPDQPERLSLEYPLLFSRNPSVLPVWLYEQQDPTTPRAACMLWAVRFRIGTGSLRVGLISLVYTDPRARGRGHAQRVVRRAVEEAARLGLGMVMLWSDLDALYAPIGFREVGVDSLLILDREITDRALSRLEGSSSPPDRDSRGTALPRPHAASAEDWRQIERLRGDRESQLQLDAHEWERLRAIPEMAVRVARDEAGAMGFAIRGRGDDFREVIHEWGGDTRLCLLCCRALLEQRLPDEPLFLLSPVERTDLSWSLRRAGARVVRRPMAWARIASAQALAEDLNDLYPGLPDLQLESPVESTVESPDGAPTTDPGVRVGSAAGRVAISEQQLLLALLGAERAALAERARERMARAIPTPILESWPLPFSVWGLESI